MKIKTPNPEQFIKRMFFLCYQAAGAEFGMGIFQRKENATEEDVWKALVGQTDYDGYEADRAKRGEFYGDYLLGRMIKFGCNLEEGIINFFREDFRPDYQAFCTKYPKIKSLLDAVAESLKTSYEVI